MGLLANLLFGELPGWTYSQMPKLTIVLAVAGEYGRVEGGLAATINRLEKVVPDLKAELVIGFDSDHWRATPLMQSLGLRFAHADVAVAAAGGGGLARLFNEGAQKAAGDCIVFLWPGCTPDSKVMADAAGQLVGQRLDWLAYLSDEMTARLRLDPGLIADNLLEYFLSCYALFPLCQAVINRRSFLRTGGFSTSPILQRSFDVGFFHASILQGCRAYLAEGEIGQQWWTIDTLPLAEDFHVPRYLAHSFRVRLARSAGVSGNEDMITDAFQMDLPPTERRRVSRLGWRNPGKDIPRSTLQACKLAVIGGPWENTHNHLCFYNYFSQLEITGLFTYVPLLDWLTVPEHDLIGVDAVVISRGRDEHVLRVIEYCKQRLIPTLYMIDDNWFSVGKDWPQQYGEMFAPGSPSIRLFTTCLRECDAVIVYNRTLAEDVRRFARQVIELPPNVRSRDFLAPLTRTRLKDEVEALSQWRVANQGVIIGYVGSPRYTDAAFRAMNDITHTQPHQVKVLLFGSIPQQTISVFGGSATVFPYLPYEEYAATLGSLAPDVLVAPLEACRTTQSKCPNKYLEYAVVGAAGVYSRVPPYTDVVRDRENGLLVDNESVQDWQTAILSLIESPSLRKRIAATAQQDVLSRYETAVVAPAFVHAILSVVRRSSTQ
jgi:glycosyltransferase involved in cell wall biosynthesis